MTILANARHEIAAQERAKGKSDAAAYMAAYPTCSKASAETAGPRLFRNVQVQNRVAELQAQSAKEVVVSTASLIDELEEARAMAKRLEMPNAMTAASVAKAKLLGLIAKPGSGRFADWEEPFHYVDAPRCETYEEWLEQRAREIDEEGAKA
jgi:hypothetical protein